MPERYHLRKNRGRLAAVSRVGTHRQRGRFGYAQVEASTRYVENYIREKNDLSNCCNMLYFVMDHDNNKFSYLVPL